MSSSISIGNFIILLGCVQGVFLAVILFSLKEGNKLAHRLLAFFLLSFAISMFWFVMWDSKWILKMPHLSLVEAPVEAVIGPLFYLYVLAITRKDFRLKKIDLLHFIAPLLVAVYFLPFYFKSAEYKIQFNLESYNSPPEIWRRFSALSAIYNIVFISLSMLIVERHRRTIKKYYSNIENINLGWLRNVFIFATISFISCVILTFFGLRFSNYVSNVAFSIGIYIMGYIGIRQKSAFTEIREPVETESAEPVIIKQEPVSKKYEKSGLTEEKAKIAMSALENLMKNEKLFLDPELNLQQLADKLGISLHHLSQILNQYQQQNFFDYINQLRVEEFKKQLLNPSMQHLSLLGLALECGFNSKASFNAAFKKYTGTTPSAFRKVMKPEVA